MWHPGGVGAAGTPRNPPTPDPALFHGNSYKGGGGVELATQKSHLGLKPFQTVLQDRSCPPRRRGGGRELFSYLYIHTHFFFPSFSLDLILFQQQQRISTLRPPLAPSLAPSLPRLIGWRRLCALIPPRALKRRRPRAAQGAQRDGAELRGNFVRERNLHRFPGDPREDGKARLRDLRLTFFFFFCLDFFFSPLLFVCLFLLSFWSRFPAAWLNCRAMDL